MNDELSTRLKYLFGELNCSLDGRDYQLITEIQDLLIPTISNGNKICTRPNNIECHAKYNIFCMNGFVCKPEEEVI